MVKEAITITIDRHIHQWIKDKGGNKSKVVNTLLTSLWIRATEPGAETSQRQLSDLMGDEKDQYMKKHMAKLNAELDRMMELEFSS